MNPAEGMQLGRYWLHREIASGGMARVHLGRLLGPVGFGRTVAIKRLHPHMVKDEHFVAMFVDEARLATRIQHPNVVPVLDVVTEGGELFLVMEYVHGESLAQLLRLAKSPPPPPVAAAIVLGVLEGLHAVHEAKGERGEALGIVHRDVSPQNILVGTDGTARVTDFGVAKGESRLVTTGDGSALKGKLPYMAPEQLSTSDVDRRADVWAAAVVLWEVLAGARLFKAPSEPLLMRAVLEKEIEPPTKGLQPLLDEVVMKGLARELGDRYASARDMADELDRVIAPASPREVGEWVEEVATTSLLQRRAVVEDMESATPTMGASVRSQLAALRTSDEVTDAGVSVFERPSIPTIREPISFDSDGRPSVIPTRVEGTGASRTVTRRRSRKLFAFSSLALLALVGTLGAVAFVRRSGAPSEKTGAAPAPESTGAHASLGVTGDSAATATPGPPAAEAGQPSSNVAVTPPSSRPTGRPRPRPRSSVGASGPAVAAVPATAAPATAAPATAAPATAAPPTVPAPVDSVRLDRRH